jgi:zinc protease
LFTPASSIRERGERDPMNIPFTRHTLDNGLSVILHEDHGVPIVAVNVWYHVGSKNEAPGRTGFAHLFEHLMFEGSAHHDKGYFHPLQEAGALLNGSTSADRTNYWEVVPTSAFELALWMESDRMGYLLPALTEAKFENQRDVVLNERRQNYENRPYGLATMATVAALFPPDHPYNWLTIGSAADLQASSLEEVRAFFSTYYHPRNASVAIAGDIDPARALDLVDAHFGEIPPGTPVAPVRRTASLAAPIRLVLEDRVELPRLYLAWHSPAMFGEQDGELDLVADLLGNGKTSRLYRALVYERRMATEVAAFQNSRELGSFFQVIATAAPGHTLGELEAVVLDEIAALTASGPTDDEVERSVAQAEAQFVYRLQKVGGFGGKSDQLNAYHVFVGDPGYFDRDLERYTSATRERLQHAAAACLGTANRVTLSVVPRDRLDLAAPDSAPAVVQ